MIRFAKLKDKIEVNQIRQQAHLLHATARPDIFRQDFDAAGERYDLYIKQYEYAVLVCVREEKIVGFAVIRNEVKQQSDFGVARKILLLEEFGVDVNCRRQGVGAEMMNFVKQYAADHDCESIVLDYWAFNNGAVDFYKEVGFDVYRVCAEYKV